MPKEKQQQKRNQAASESSLPLEKSTGFKKIFTIFYYNNKNHTLSVGHQTIKYVSTLYILECSVQVLDNMMKVLLKEKLSQIENFRRN